nr:conjugal transfer protein TraF [Klebsiella pneumoniae]
MAPILKQLSQMYGFEVLGVSVDGAGLPDFPNPVDGCAVVTKSGVLEKRTRLPLLHLKN